MGTAKGVSVALAVAIGVNEEDKTCRGVTDDATVWCWGVVGGDHRSGSPGGGFVESCR